MRKWQFISTSIVALSLITTNCKKATTAKKLDPISEFDQILKQVNDTSFPEIKKFPLLENYIDDELTKGSISAKNLSQIAYIYLNWDSIEPFKRVNKLALTYAEVNKDTFSLADSHWNYANFFLKQNEYENSYFHYNEARKGFSAVSHDYYNGKMLINMAMIRGRLRDYIGAESLTIEAIKKIQNVDKPKSLYAAYNHLAILSTELEEFEKSISYHEKAISYLDEEDNFLKPGSLNNIGLVYQRMNQFDKAQQSFREALGDKNLKTNNLSLYAKLIDNQAYTNFLMGNYGEVEKPLLTALAIRDSIENIPGQIMSHLHLAEYYFNMSDSTLAFKNAQKARQLSKQINNNRDYLMSLHALKRIDPKNAVLYADEYIQFNDSLQTVERKLKNQLTRIDLETDEYKEEVQRSKEEQLIIIAIAMIGLFIGVLIFIISFQRTKNKLLSLRISEKEANEEIFMLTLEQQKSKQEGKNLERERISEELHDGVLSQLFGTRMGLGFLKLNGENTETDKYKDLIEELKTIEMEIRAISHDLKSYEIEKISNLETLVANLMDRYSEISNFKYKLNIEDGFDWKSIPKDDLLHLYRIIQEIIKNIVQHAKAKHVDIEIRSLKEHIKITIIDDGIGFKKSKQKPGIGLKNIRSRVRKINGRVMIESKQKEGTKLELILNKVQ